MLKAKKRAVKRKRAPSKPGWLRRISEKLDTLIGLQSASADTLSTIRRVQGRRR